MNTEQTSRSWNESTTDTTQKKKIENRQAFYFNDNLEFVVESNKGVYVGDEQIVKLNGIFTCNAKTMAQILTIVNNNPMKLLRTDDSYVVLQDTKIGDEISKINEQWQETIKEYEEHKKEWEYNERKLREIRYLVKRHNELPWYKRIFKKIEY